MTSVQVDRPTDGVTRITMNRPDRLNALDVELIDDLRGALDDVTVDLDCRVVVLTGAGRAFSAGLDLTGYGDDQRMGEQGSTLGLLTRQREISSITEQLHRLRQPVIAAVNGPAAGGGLAFVCASDIRIAAQDAIFTVAFIRAGYSACDIGVSWLLPRIVGAGAAHELMLTGRRFSAAEARQIGLLADVTAPEDLQSRALAKAAEIMTNAPASVELTKQGMWMALESPSLIHAIEFENRQQMITAMTEDAAEATSAFLGKRTPVFHRR
jgi:enoyl-CoA hydratase/carnithine racemase